MKTYSMITFSKLRLAFGLLACMNLWNEVNADTTEARCDIYPAGEERVLNFDDGEVTMPDGGDLTWDQREGDWHIGIDGREYYVVPEAVVYGG